MADPHTNTISNRRGGSATRLRSPTTILSGIGWVGVGCIRPFTHRKVRRNTEVIFNIVAGEQGARSTPLPTAFPSTLSSFKVFVIIFVALLILLPSVAHAQVSVPLFEYRLRLRQTADALRQAAKQPAEQRVATLESARAKLAEVGVVTLADGSSFAPANTALLAALADPPTDLAPLTRQVEGLAASLRDSAGNGDALARLPDVLRDFNYEPKPRERDFIDDFGQFFVNLSEWYQNLDRTPKAFGTATVLGLLAAGVAWLATRGARISRTSQRLWVAGSGGLVFVLVLAYLLFIDEGRDGTRTLAQSGGWALFGVILLLILLVLVGMVYSRRLFARSRAELPLQAGEQNMTSQQSTARATEAASSGDYRSAIRYLYLTTLILLDERGLLRYDRSLTNREYLLRLAREGELSGLLTPVVDIFDAVWYGHREPDAAEYERYAGLVAQVRALATTPTQTPPQGGRSQVASR